MQLIHKKTDLDHRNHVFGDGTTTRTNSDSGKLNGSHGVEVRRTEAQSHALEFNAWTYNRNPFSKKQFNERWIALPPLSEMGRQDGVRQVSRRLMKTFGLLDPGFRKNKIDLTGTALQFSQFLHRTHRVPQSVLQDVQSSPPASKRVASRAIALAYHQAAVAVGAHFGDASVAQTMPNLGALLGHFNLDDGAAALGGLATAAAVAALALAPTLPVGKRVSVKAHFEFQQETVRKEVEENGAIAHSELHESAGELYVECVDNESSAQLHRISVASETRKIDTDPAHPVIEGTYLSPAKFRLGKASQSQPLPSRASSDSNVSQASSQPA